MTVHVQTPAVPLSDISRIQELMRTAEVDLILGKEDSSLHYLSGHYSDSTLCHFYDDWACALAPVRSDVPAALVVQEYARGYEFVEEIAPQEDDVLIPKKHPSAFFGTALASHLIDKRVDTFRWLSRAARRADASAHQ